MSPCSPRLRSRYLGSLSGWSAGEEREIPAVNVRCSSRQAKWDLVRSFGRAARGPGSSKENVDVQRYRQSVLVHVRRRSCSALARVVCLPT